MKPDNSSDIFLALSLRELIIICGAIKRLKDNTALGVSEFNSIISKCEKSFEKTGVKVNIN